MARTPEPWYRASHRQWYATLNNKQIPLGVRDPDDKAAAWAALNQLLRGVDDLKSTLAAQRPAIRPGRIPQVVGEFLAERSATVKPITMRGYAQYLGWLAKTFPNDTAAGLSVPAVVRAAASVATWSDTHRANVLACVGAMLKWCGRPDKVPTPPKASRGADAVIPEPVYRQCLRESAGDFRQLIQFLWHTGCRPGEASGLTVEAVGWDSQTISLKQHKTRHKGKARIFPLCAEAFAVVSEQRERYGSGLLFRGLRGKRLGLQALTMRFERLSAKIGRRVCSYDFRHTWATRALKAGIPAAHVAAMLGHSSTAMVFLHYGHLAEEVELLREHANRLAAG